MCVNLGPGNVVVVTLIVITNSPVSSVNYYRKLQTTTQCNHPINRPITECFQLEFAVLVQETHVGLGSDLLRLLSASIIITVSVAVVETVPRVTPCFTICGQHLHSAKLRLQLIT